MPEVEIRKGYMPGSIGRVVELHGRYYHKNWGFGAYFETKVARELSEFMDRYDDRRDGFWIATLDGQTEGSITLDGLNADGRGVHMRWFIISDALRGQGVGNRLINAAVNFCKIKGYEQIYLWTFEGLHAARHLYEKAGFTLAEQRQGRQWGREVNEQRFELLIRGVE